MVFGFKSFRKKPVQEVSKSKKDEVNSAIAHTENTVKELSKRQTELEARIKKCLEEAKTKASANDKVGALAALRKKKLFEEEINRISSSIIALESQNITLESAHMQHMAINALSTGLSAHKKIQETMNVNKIDVLMDELEEQREAQAEIYDAMTQGVPQTLEFEDELNELMAEEEKEKEVKDVEADLKSIERMLDKLSTPDAKNRPSLEKETG
ncbi:SNF7 family member protein [Theileria equi strain WA]|uniref:SNF7 family member protein n=1 Tax=Theileria equi strain WA TaxID=1537102 RepID=L0B0C5_THEEQ|nr:SNF7 family member protein [Theileria equi strain WA]AFZ80933.1 SNF7 family member protein [Theileria equi strain WA]|eukprot:XP_004830599.1 SNF7 family member protein [Theileria equi strain WA]